MIQTCRVPSEVRFSTSTNSTAIAATKVSQGNMKIPYSSAVGVTTNTHGIGAKESAARAVVTHERGSSTPGRVQHHFFCWSQRLRGRGEHVWAECMYGVPQAVPPLFPVLNTSQTFLSLQQMRSTEGQNGSFGSHSQLALSLPQSATARDQERGVGPSHVSAERGTRGQRSTKHGQDRRS